MRRLQAAAVSADHGVPLVHVPLIEVGAGGSGRVRSTSYEEVHHGIQPAFQARTPYLVLLVELDTQKAKPTEHESLRVIGNLTTTDGILAPPDVVKRVGIGSRMRMVFSDVCPGLSLPQWILDETTVQPEKPWRYPQE